MLSRRQILCAGLLAPITHSAFGATTFTVGSEYLLVEPSIPSTSKKIQVVDFFAYTCPHCFHFQPIFDRWAENVADDVEIVRCPVAWDDRQLPLTKTFYALEMLGLQSTLSNRFFESVYYETHPYSFETLDQDILAFMVDNGVDKTKWLQAYNSFGVITKSHQASKLWQDYGIDSTPMVGVGGRYTTGPHLAGSREKTPVVIDFLIEQCRQAMRV
ncbi:Thiol:disulfide interchange protein DsbA [gut metagenome]|uniref:Thiol:disulfide interchange protein DsbA n=1 Tax=gut metagenome TaxID=749906 RepID=J9GY97_9ZZZZ